MVWRVCGVWVVLKSVVWSGGEVSMLRKCGVGGGMVGCVWSWLLCCVCCACGAFGLAAVVCAWWAGGVDGGVVCGGLVVVLRGRCVSERVGLVGWCVVGGWMGGGLWRVCGWGCV